MKVFLSVDTEIWPFSDGWPTVPLAAAHTDFSAEIGFYIEGNTGKGSFGLPFQLDCLKQHGLKATFFVESLSAGVTGSKVLKDIVALIGSYGQEVQLHCHTEWLSELRDAELPARFRQYLRQFSLAEQTAIIARASANLRQAGAGAPCAFRAGSFGANFDTLRALAANRIRFDSSHNACFLGISCGLDTGELLTQPRLLEGVHEFPMSVFSDYPGHYRHAQLGACSYGELTEALLGAWRAGWYAFVILLHGSELLGERRNFTVPAGPAAIVVRRFRRLCEFLARNTDKFRTTAFSEIDPAAIPSSGRLLPSATGLHRTAWRMAEQLAGRIL